MLRREGAVCALFLSLLHAGVTLNAVPGSVDLADADVAFNTFLHQFWSNQLNYLADQSYPYNTTATAYWTYAQGWDCVLDNIALHKQLTGLKAHLPPHPRGLPYHKARLRNNRKLSSHNSTRDKPAEDGTQVLNASSRAFVNNNFPSRLL